MDKNAAAQLRRKQLLEQKAKLREGLPHLHGYRLYKWARKFFDSKNRLNFLCAGNQVSKSSTMLRKAIHWATEPKLWPQLWDNRPTIFWYFYPTKEVATIEFQKKWVIEFLPKGDFKDHPQFGWREEYDNKKMISAIHFNTGVSIYFKAYAQDIMNLQTATVHAVFCDEELPEEYFPELRARLTATRGHFHMAFTATLGQEIWRATMEDKPEEAPFPTALKIQVSLFDCMVYEDGTPSKWTRERIQEEIDGCSTPREVQRRIMGRFVKSEGLAYESFTRLLNVRPVVEEVPDNWLIYSGVDIGSGGPTGHPSAMSFIAVRPDFRFARVFRGCRMDKILTTAGDTYLEYVKRRGDLKVCHQSYDFSCKDFHTIATRNNDPFSPADKNRNDSNTLLNTLFKHGILVIDDIPELQPHIKEFETLSKDTPKPKAKDDAIDSIRYPCMAIPWDYSVLTTPSPKADKKVDQPEDAITKSRHLQHDSFSRYNEIIESEIAEWNDFYEV